jgi:hypothetical protein
VALKHSPARPRKKEIRRRPKLGPLSVDHDDQVLTFVEWCSLNRIGERTGRRILARPDGPVVTMLSAQRIGITVNNNRAWQQRRTRARAGA